MIEIEQKRLEEILNCIMQVAKGNYDVEVEVTDKNDKIDALAIGINMMIDDIKMQQEERLAEQKRLFSMALEKINEGLGLITENFGSLENVFSRSEQEAMGNILTSKPSKVSMARLFENFINVLTKREIEVLRYIADGFSNKEIAEKLDISVRTSMTHRTNMMKKLNVRTKKELIDRAVGGTRTNILS